MLEQQIQPMIGERPSSGKEKVGVAYPEVLYPKELQEEEQKLLETRREPDAPSVAKDRLVGVGLSGGGIRSATFALGLFQGLAGKRGLLREIDFLSTVSGGGYFGSFLGRLFTRSCVTEPKDVEDVLRGEKEPEILRFLRENGRYLSPNGSGDLLLMGSVALRNWFAIHLVLGLFVLSLFLGLQSLRVGLELFPPRVSEFFWAEDALIWWSPLLWLPLLSFVFVVVPIGWAYWLVEPKKKAMQNEAAHGRVAQEISALSPKLGLLLVLIISLILLYIHLGNEKPAVLWGSLAGITLLTFSFYYAARRLKGHGYGVSTDKGKDEDKDKRKDEDKDKPKVLFEIAFIRHRLGRWVTQALVVTGLLLALAVVDSLGQTLYATLQQGTGNFWRWVTAVSGSLGGLAWLGHWAARFLTKGPQGPRPSLPVTLIAGTIAVLIMLLLLVSFDAGSHAISFGLASPKGAPNRLLDGEASERSVALQLATGHGATVDLHIRRETSDEEKSNLSVGVRDGMRTVVSFLTTLVLSIFFGQTLPFVNRSTHQPFYTARLTRAYLGASNEKRRDTPSITDPVEDDDAELADYWPPPKKKGAPIHLINVTINETVEGRSQVQQQDRKGLAFALGPCGLSAGAKHHVVWQPKNRSPFLEETPECLLFPKKVEEKDFCIFEYPTIEGETKKFTGEMLSLGGWIALSGAAISTGVGMNTSLGLSFLAGFANVRLGRWWDSGISKRAMTGKRKLSLRIENFMARLFPVQTFLLDELVARFPGTARRHWYISDGGHFENLGGYELLRRRLRLIVIVDAGMDPDYKFEDLANLVRKARLDFGAEIRFLTKECLDKVVDPKIQAHIGTLDDLRRGTREGEVLRVPNQAGFSLKHAALARVTYAEGKETSWLLYIKPTLTDSAPTDVLEYHSSHPKFPHEPTADQFFDEAQWESYRRLGQHIAENLFGEIDHLTPGAGPNAKGTLLQNWDWSPSANEDLKSKEQCNGSR